MLILELGKEVFTKDHSSLFQRFLKEMANGNSVGALELCKKNRGIVNTTLRIIAQSQNESELKLRQKLDVHIKKTVAVLDRHLPFVSILAAVAPLLGLLGTVTGMVHTFEVITEFGNSNPILMADGISEALITTQSGLLVAFPLVILKHHLEERIQWQKKQIESVVTQYINQRYHFTDR